MTRSNVREIVAHLIFEMNFTEDSAHQLVETTMEPEYYSSLAQETEIYSERPNEKQMEYIRTLTRLTLENCSEIDGFIERYSKGWKIGRISKTALAVLRCAICEILYMDDIPNAAAINEAVELAKGYDEPETVSFVNGVLGGFMRGESSILESEQ